MHHPFEIKNKIFWVGAVDWNIRDFHGYSTNLGTTYNAYLVKDEKAALFDTVKKPFTGDLIEHIQEIIEPEKIDYLIVNHVEMDHSGGLPEIVELVKPEKIYCSANGKKAMIAHFHREDWPYEVVKSGDTISLGSKTIRFIETKMLHWPDSMFSFIEEDGLLISQDAFGQHWATTERFDDEVNKSELFHQAAKYYANILMLYSPLVQKLLSDVSAMGLKIDMIAPDHGLIWRKYVDEIFASWGKWSRRETVNKAVVVYDTMWESTAKMAAAVVHGLVDQSVSVRLMNLAYCHRSDIVTEMLEARAVIIGSATLNNGMLPRVADLLCYLKGLRPANKIGAAFGSFGWGGEAVKLVSASMEEMGIELVSQGVKANYVPTETDLQQCFDLGCVVAEAMKAS